MLIQSYFKSIEFREIELWKMELREVELWEIELREIELLNKKQIISVH
jgi:hypothetical protein